MAESEKRIASCYLVVQGRDFSGGHPRTFVATRVTKGPPANLASDELAVRLNLSLPRDILDTLVPVANIDVPGDLIQQPVVDVVAVDANGVQS